MLRLRPFRLHRPRSLQEALFLLGRYPEARVLAGGTDLLPSLKRGESSCDILVSLRGVPELRGIRRAGGELVLGAGTRLAEIASHPEVRGALPVLAEAAGRVAAPSIRNAATLGGNLCLEPRCRYLNQSELFRQSLGGCLKTGGTVCHVVKGARRCMAALSSDLVPVLAACGARLLLAGPRGERRCDLTRFYTGDGLRPTRLQAGEMVREVRVPLPAPGTLLAWRKWAVRRSLDFPLVSAAIRLEGERGRLRRGLLSVGVLTSRPRLVELSELEGRSLDPALGRRVGEIAYRRCKPLPNVLYDPEYRRHRLAVEVERAIWAMLS